mmetsp:Transcript_43941/g.100676  ORF Transcript_43941/g.100676 Transcript_43941/m.100676 type:complete len:185 (+) Transcript_43941:1343-1897(+)
MLSFLDPVSERRAASELCWEAKGRSGFPELGALPFVYPCVRDLPEAGALPKLRMTSPEPDAISGPEGDAPSIVRGALPERCGVAVAAIGPPPTIAEVFSGIGTPSTTGKALPRLGALPGKGLAELGALSTKGGGNPSTAPELGEPESIGGALPEHACPTSTDGARAGLSSFLGSEPQKPEEPTS